MAEKKKAVIETRVIDEFEPVQYVVLQTKMSPQEFYELMKELQSATNRAETFCFRKFEAKRDQLKDDDENKDLQWQKKYWGDEWSKTSDLDNMLRKWIEEHEKWDPDYEEKEGTENEED